MRQSRETLIQRKEECPSTWAAATATKHGLLPGMEEEQEFEYLVPTEEAALFGTLAGLEAAEVGPEIAEATEHQEEEEDIAEKNTCRDKNRCREKPRLVLEKRLLDTLNWLCTTRQQQCRCT